jgi:hypothetical protein
MISSLVMSFTGRERRIIARLISDRRVTRPAYGVILITICALLSSCNEEALVVAETRLYKEPLIQGEVLAIIPKGSVIAVSNCTNGWCRAKWNGQRGYALAKNVRAQRSGLSPLVEDQDDEPGNQDVGGDDD